MVCQEHLIQKKMERLMKKLNDIEERLLIQKRMIEEQQREVKVLMEVESLLSVFLEWYKMQLEWYGKARNHRGVS
mgnify:FL=1